MVRQMGFVKMGVVTEKPYAGKLADERRAERRSRLVAAGLELMGTPGSGPTSVRAVCAQSGLTSRYFYESFSSIDELVVAVFDEMMASTIHQATEAIASSDHSIEGIVHALSDVLFQAMVDDPRALRVGFLESWSSEALMRRRVETLHACAHLIAGTVADATDATPARRRAIDVASFMVVGGLLESILGWLDDSLSVSRDSLAAGFTVAAVAALKGAAGTA